MRSSPQNDSSPTAPVGEYSSDETLFPDLGQRDNIPPENGAIVSSNDTSTWPFKTLLNIAKMAKGRVNRSMINFIKTHLQGTRLIFVVGQTGSGKTSLLEEITSQDLKVGHSAKSGTLGYQVLPAIVHGKQYLFVDTPGFGAEDLKDKDVYEDIMSCVCTLGQWVTIAGIMFVHDVRSQRLTFSEMRTIRWLQCFCGPQFFRNVTIVQTQWDRITEDDMDQVRDIANELEFSAFDDVLFPKHVKGGCVYNHGVRLENKSEWVTLSRKKKRQERSRMAADFILNQYGRCGKVARLQVLEELAQGWGLYETEAAKSLFDSVEHPLICNLRYKTTYLDLDEKISPKVKEEEAAAADTSPEQQAAESSTWKWWEIAKQVAWTFWGFQRTGHTKYTEYMESVATDVWERLKGWWSGETPPQ
ncbi:uncharacterized protein NFIA_076840 [Aspergillus fischeri NRRL 181]|uniref:AIG1-type G domain-containing protein n=1 Tax=Neosartorya fischeri (strain ATCC 1020 / DSM 3700 / CBS 544.65 / FGSC A1164 / JCM 1740 / NRRL 181 / WB 181) TaxID=331117 RepID=A1DEE5_NEOFI|nr:uncharacterized protein NFIA_076840 [Aspergillus fischeri NRRL 181]EAW17752.1 hypothetical protein NFIA_076840 [Aspergillus fischeri NRRL 181]KAG2012592.1 hypothetical protein GB937_006941 [Aspergillus fischeri]